MDGARGAREKNLNVEQAQLDRWLRSPSVKCVHTAKAMNVPTNDAVPVFGLRGPTEQTGFSRARGGGPGVRLVQNRAYVSVPTAKGACGLHPGPFFTRP
jgi:hypothetical protein